MSRHAGGSVSRTFRAVVLAIAALLGAVASASRLTAAESSQSVEIVGVQAGFDGLYKVGQWTPVRVTLEGELPETLTVELTVADNEGVPSRVTVEHQRAAGNNVDGFVRFGQAEGELSVRVRAKNHLLAERIFTQNSKELTAAMPAGELLLVALGAAIAPVDSDATSEAGRALRFARVVDTSSLPTRWFGYEGVDQLILTTSDPALLRGLTGERLDALDRWVQLGGRIVLCVGSAANEVLAPGAPLTRFAPGKFDRLMPLRQTGALETYADSTDRLELQPAGGPFEAARLADVRGRIEAFEGNQPRDLPLVVRAAYGFGQVVFVAVDLDRPPLSTWSARQKLVDKVLALPKLAGAEESSDTLGQVTKLGYSDLVGQLLSGLDQFTGVQLVPFSVVALIVVLYILCIGPGDYFFLRHVLHRMELTWVTFPLIVVAFSAAAYALAYHLKGSELRVNQVDLVDVDTESRLVRGTHWSTVYSPEIETFDFSLDPHPDAISVSQPQVLLSWLGLPGSDAAAAGRNSLFSTPYDFSRQLNAIRGMPIGIWSTRSLVGRWWTESETPIQSELVDRGDRMLAGALRGSADLELADAVLFYDRWAYPVRQWKGGGTITVEKQLEPQTVETWLRHITMLDEKEARAPYDRGTTDLERILEMLMFHDLAGGQRYTALTHRVQAFTDLSAHVRLGRAVLVGRGPAGAAALNRDGHPLPTDGGKQLTYYRFVLPVRPVERD